MGCTTVALTEEESARFWKRVFKTDGCWYFGEGGPRPRYGSFEVAGKSVVAHRVSFIVANGDIAPESFVCHRCDTYNCVRPDHLFLGDAESNMADYSRKSVVWEAYAIWKRKAEPTFEHALERAIKRSRYSRDELTPIIREMMANGWHMPPMERLRAYKPPVPHKFRKLSELRRILEGA